ncbi:hypothetical protein KCU92_g8062, partial [Aureobasidium melanogenum]
MLSTTSYIFSNDARATAFRRAVRSQVARRQEYAVPGLGLSAQEVQRAYLRYCAEQQDQGQSDNTQQTPPPYLLVMDNQAPPAYSLETDDQTLPASTPSAMDQAPPPYTSTPAFEMTPTAHLDMLLYSNTCTPPSPPEYTEAITITTPPPSYEDSVSVRTTKTDQTPSRTSIVYNNLTTHAFPPSVPAAMSLNNSIERPIALETLEPSTPPMEPPTISANVSSQPQSSAEDETQYPKGRTKFLIVSSVTLAYVLTSMDATIVSVVVPSLTDEFHTIRDVGWYSAAYRLCICSFQFMFGKLYKTLPAKNIFLGSVLIFMVGSAICATASAGSRYTWNSPVVIGLLVSFSVLLVIFGLVQWLKGESATLPPRILCNRSVLSGFVFTLFTNSATMVILYYLPTYFQVVRGSTAAKSGLYQIPAIAGDIIGVGLQSTGVTLIGYYTPFMWAATILMPVSAGLLTTIKTRTSLAEVLVMTGFFGFAGGIGFLSPQSAVQMALPKNDASIGLSIILFAEQFGAALFVLAAQNVFQNRLVDNLHTSAPSLNATGIGTAGLSDLKDLVAPADLMNVLVAVDQSVAQTWYMAVALACMTIVGSATMDWRSVKEKQS